MVVQVVSVATSGKWFKFFNIRFRINNNNFCWWWRWWMMVAPNNGGNGGSGGGGGSSGSTGPITMGSGGTLETHQAQLLVKEIMVVLVLYNGPNIILVEAVEVLVQLVQMVHLEV
jgi:hypothetical protein